MSVLTDVADVPADNIVKPPLANAVEKVLYPQHVAGYGGFRSDWRRTPPSWMPPSTFSLLIVSNGALLQALDFYSGVVPSKERLQRSRHRRCQVRSGLQARSRGHVALRTLSPGPRGPARPGEQPSSTAPCARKSAIQEALSAMDAYLQEQEDQARERLAA